MTLEQLEQYVALKREEKLWEAELSALIRKSGGVVKDTVKGSSANYPYTVHPVSITGVQTKPNKRISVRAERLEKRRERTAREREEIENFIDGLQDSQLRQIITYRYIKGHSWAKIAQLIGGKNTADGVRMRVNRMFTKID